MARCSTSASDIQISVYALSTLNLSLSDICEAHWIFVTRYHYFNQSLWSEMLTMERQILTPKSILLDLISNMRLIY